MAINAVLLRKVLQQIETHPETWDQRTWRCGTAMCFAGWTAQLAGGRWIGDTPLLHAEECEPSHDALDGTNAVHPYPRAARLLGLTTDQADALFAGDLDLDGIRHQVAELIDQVHHVTIRLVPADELVPDEAHPDGRPPLEIIEHRPGQPPFCYGTARGIELHELQDHAGHVADKMGLLYVDPIDPAVTEALRLAEVAW